MTRESGTFWGSPHLNRHGHLLKVVAGVTIPVIAGGIFFFFQTPLHREDISTVSAPLLPQPLPASKVPERVTHDRPVAGTPSSTVKRPTTPPAQPVRQGPRQQTRPPVSAASAATVPAPQINGSPPATKPPTGNQEYLRKVPTISPPTPAEPPLPAYPSPQADILPTMTSPDAQTLYLAFESSRSHTENTWHNEDNSVTYRLVLAPATFLPDGRPCREAALTSWQVLPSGSRIQQSNNIKGCREMLQPYWHLQLKPAMQRSEAISPERILSATAERPAPPPGKVIETMDDFDIFLLNTALESMRSNEEYSWNNPKSNNTFRVVLSPARFIQGGSPCRGATVSSSPTGANLHSSTAEIIEACRDPNKAVWHIQKKTAPPSQSNPDSLRPVFVSRSDYGTNH